MITYVMGSNRTYKKAPTYGYTTKFFKKVMKNFSAFESESSGISIDNTIIIPAHFFESVFRNLDNDFIFNYPPHEVVKEFITNCEEEYSRTKNTVLAFGSSKVNFISYIIDLHSILNSHLTNIHLNHEDLVELWKVRDLKYQRLHKTRSNIRARNPTICLRLQDIPILMAFDFDNVRVVLRTIYSQGDEWPQNTLCIKKPLNTKASI